MNELLVYSNISIKNALKQMGKGGEKCLIVIDDQEIFLGTLNEKSHYIF